MDFQPAPDLYLRHGEIESPQLTGDAKETCSSTASADDRGYGAASGFSDGYTVAMALAGALSLVGSMAAFTLDPIRPRPYAAQPEPTT
jgi:hypothetical protein